MQEVYVTCPQCGHVDSYFEYEEGDFTGGIFWIQQPWECSQCAYPRVTWTKWGRSGTTSATTYVEVNT